MGTLVTKEARFLYFVLTVFLSTTDLPAQTTTIAFHITLLLAEFPNTTPLSANHSYTSVSVAMSLVRTCPRVLPGLEEAEF